MAVQCVNGEPRVEGDSEVDGACPAPGAEVALDYSDTSGSTTGKLLPTGRRAIGYMYRRLGRE